MKFGPLMLLSLAVVQVVFVAWYFWRNRKIMAECGHETKIEDWIEAHGERVKIEVLVENGTTPFCHKCLEKMTIQCAWCGRPIFITRPVTLYSPWDKDMVMPEYAVQYNKKNNSYIGCTHWDCETMAACDRAGFWWPPGVVERVPTPIEQSLMDIQRGGDGVVIINDISKP